MYEIGPICTCLIDQNRYIGEDPIGYGCSNKAKYRSEQNGREAFICESCHQLLVETPDRVEIVWCTIDQWKEIVRKVLHDLQLSS